MDVRLLSRQIMKFGATGLLNTGVDFLVFFSLIYAAHIHYIFANLLAFLVAVTVSYAINKNWTFAGQSSNHNLVNEWIRFTIISVGGFLVATGVLLLTEPILSLVIAKILATGASFIWNFTLVRFHLWKQ